MESQEQSKEGYLVVGQNLYDQPPFSTILPKLSQELGLELDQLRRYMSTFCNGVVNEGMSERRCVRYHFRKPLRPVAEKLKEKMQGYPYWVEYIHPLVLGRAYDHDGKQSAQGNNPEVCPIETYANWVRRKLERQENLKLAGIEEVFP